MSRQLPDLETLEYEVIQHKAKGNEGRLAVLALLKIEECCVCDLANTLEQPVSTISQNLKILKAAGLIKSRKEGKYIHYSLKRPDKP